MQPLHAVFAPSSSSLVSFASMALCTRIVQFSYLLATTSQKSQILRKLQRGCLCMCAQVVQKFSTSYSRRDSLPPNFYLPDALVDGDEPRTGFVESKEDFKFVERLIPSLEPPTPPVHEKYPTPSGWSPPTGAVPDSPYIVRRTRYHSIPVFIKLKYSRTQRLTEIKNIDGDIWALAEELKSYLETMTGQKVPVKVHEVARKVWYRGMFKEETKKWLADKGF